MASWLLLFSAFCSARLYKSFLFYYQYEKVVTGGEVALKEQLV